MKCIVSKVVFPFALSILISSCGDDIESEGDATKQPQAEQSTLSQPDKPVPSMDSINKDTLVGSNLEDKNKTKKSKKIIIPQVFAPDPGPEPDPWPDPLPPDPYWGWRDPIDPPAPVEPLPPAYVEPVLIAEVEAVFPGGQAEMMKFINNNIKISEYDLELGCQGKVYVRIVVTTEGKITNPEVLKGIQGCPGLSKSALDVVALMPDWIPAVNYGQKVSSYVTFPIVIKYQ
jgi:hypothetical protein